MPEFITKSGNKVNLVREGRSLFAEFFMGKKIKTAGHWTSTARHGEGFQCHVNGKGALLQLGEDAKNWVEEQNKRIEEERDLQRIEEYKHLEAQLPTLPSTDALYPLPQEKIDEIRKEIAEQEKSLLFYRKYEEDEGIALGISSKIESLKKQLRNACQHKWEVKINRTLTSYASKKIERVCKCACGKIVRHEAVDSTDFFD